MDVNLSGKDRVPRFWANSADNEQVIVDLMVLGIGVCFGAIHCIAWGFSSLTHTELLMWRVLCIAITAVPVYITLGLLLGGWLLPEMGLEKFITTVLFFFALYLELYFIS